MFVLAMRNAQNRIDNGGLPLVAANFLFAVKIMLLPCKKISDTYGNSILLYGEEDFAATKDLHQNEAEMAA